MHFPLLNQQDTEMNIQDRKKYQPDMGLEPMTLRLKV